MIAQQDFGAYVNKIFFNAFSRDPDSSIHKFLSDFAPVLLNPRQATDGYWIAYPAKETNLPVTITHSYIFSKHPFIDAKIKQGEFKVFTNVYNDSIEPDFADIQSIEVTLEFVNLEDGQALFEKLNKDLTSIGTVTTYRDRYSNKILKAYCEDLLYEIPCGVRICLMVTPGFRNLYQLIITTN
jgi:hypothetical protein